MILRFNRTQGARTVHLHGMLKRNFFSFLFSFAIHLSRVSNEGHVRSMFMPINFSDMDRIARTPTIHSRECDFTRRDDSPIRADNHANTMEFHDAIFIGGLESADGASAVPQTASYNAEPPYKQYIECILIRVIRGIQLFKMHCHCIKRNFR